MQTTGYAGTAELSSAGVINYEAESKAYFARMTTPPSLPFKIAVNAAIAAWKAAGAWSMISALWIHAADTQQAALLNITGDATLDATVTGAPTFTPLKGFSGLSNTALVNYGGINSTKAGVWSALGGLFNSQYSSNNALAQVLFACSQASNLNSYAGIWQTSTTGLLQTPGGGAKVPISTVVASSPFVGLGWATDLYCGSADIGSGGASSGVDSAYKTAPFDPVGTGFAHPIKRLCVYGFLSNSLAAGPVARKFSTILAKLVEDLGALD